MKLLTTAVTLLMVSLANAEVFYWCTGNGKCNNAPGVGPTYDCGKKLGYDYYDSNRKRWRTSGDTVKKFWETGGFYDCCHAKNKGACYDIQNQ
ncbi:uncharacterized protein P884DRAFT_264804 [Thermothelomyces heterothallicus CBS 202.75]|uniref:uncharacterized protein n=1 Tax=Thermothelomyces heterothallicus CBS 202.75 TaxID=1149848 RepID=UPI00374224DE